MRCAGIYVDVYGYIASVGVDVHVRKGYIYTRYNLTSNISITVLIIYYFFIVFI